MVAFSLDILIVNPYRLAVNEHRFKRHRQLTTFTDKPSSQRSNTSTQGLIQPLDQCSIRWVTPELGQLFRQTCLYHALLRLVIYKRQFLRMYYVCAYECLHCCPRQYLSSNLAFFFVALTFYDCSNIFQFISWRILKPLTFCIELLVSTEFRGITSGVRWYEFKVCK